MLPNLTLAELTKQVNGAFKNYHSVLALARSPLADSALVHPLLVLDDVSPTADERGQALRLVLQWAVMRLAPDAIPFPLGTERPYDDPTWRDPRWWRYNILRHRYLEPLHPDEFVEGGRFTETLLTLTGITSPDAFFDERNRAIREIAQRLQEQLTGGGATNELRALALEEALRPIQQQATLTALLGIAATFDDVFPRSLLLQMARTERVESAVNVLDELTANRYLLMGDGGINLWLSPVLQRFVYARQPIAQLRSRHLAAVAFYRREEDVLRAVEHLCHAQEWSMAATLLLDVAEELVNDLQIEELMIALHRFKAEQIEVSQWCAVQTLLSDLYRRQGQQEVALTACREALQVAETPTQQAALYWRLGKLYVKRSPLQALGYYQQAVEQFPPDDPTVVELLKDRAWLYILRQEWEAAEIDLQQALHLVARGVTDLHADILDALAHLYLEQQQYDAAIDYARRSLLLREEAGDLLQVAKSFNNLGNFYNRMGEVDEAIAAHDEAIQLYQRLNNQELEAEAWLNQGVVYHIAGRHVAAITNYRKSLALSQQLGLLLTEVTAHSNLAEAHAEIGEHTIAERHWHYGYTLSKESNLYEELDYLQELQERFALATELRVEESAADAEAVTVNSISLPPRALLSPDEQAILQLAEERQQITPKLLMTHLHVSKATATRRLTAMVTHGLLRKYGRGRGTVYLLAAQTMVRPTTVHEHDDSTTPRVQADKEEICAQLQGVAKRHAAQLQQEHHVAALAVICGANFNQPWAWRFGVRFHTLPTVPEFFRLEHALSTWCAQPVDLIPAELVEQGQDDGQQESIEWIVLS